MWKNFPTRRVSVYRKDCSVVKLKCLFCRMTGHVKICRKFAKSEAKATGRTLKDEESFIFNNSTPGCQFTRKISVHNNMRRTNVTNIEWNCERFQRSFPELPTSVAVEITMMAGIHVTFRCAPKKPVSPGLCRYRVQDLFG